jgi:hypothetical protein
MRGYGGGTGDVGVATEALVGEPTAAAMGSEGRVR